jgi:hypothetical protein
VNQRVCGLRMGRHRSKNTPAQDNISAASSRPRAEFVAARVNGPAWSSRLFIDQDLSAEEKEEESGSLPDGKKKMRAERQVLSLR